MSKLYKIICPHCGGEMDTTLSYQQQMGLTNWGKGKCANPECQKEVLIVYDVEFDKAYADILEVAQESKIDIYEDGGTVKIQKKKNLVS